MPIKVLIVDDIVETRDNVRRLLSLYEDFMVVGEASNGKIALKQVESLKPDIVLMDINMPEMDGITACRLISSLYPHSSIIMMTVQGGLEYVQRSLEVGAKAYVTKPFSIQELITTIKTAFQSENHRRWVGTAVHNISGKARNRQYAKRLECIKKDENVGAGG